MNIYEIIHNTNSKMLYNYVILIAIIIFMCKNISVSSGIILGLTLMCVYLLYMYQYNEKNIITNAQREKLKYEEIESYLKNKLIEDPLYEYPEIVDFLFYLEPYEQYNKSVYENIVNYFINFVNLYKKSIIDTDNYNYFEIDRIKNNIILSLEDFTLMGANEEDIQQLKINVQNIFNVYLKNLKTEYEKKIYYNGYNIETKILDNSNIIAHNYYNSDNQNIRGVELINFYNLLSS
jgi:hypothetical protein